MYYYRATFFPRLEKGSSRTCRGRFAAMVLRCIIAHSFMFWVVIFKWQRERETEKVSIPDIFSARGAIKHSHATILLQV